MAISEQQQQINMNKFMAAQERAKKLIAMDAQQEVMEGRKRTNSTPSLSESLGGSKNNLSYQSYDDYEESEPQYITEEQMQNIHNKSLTQPIRQCNVMNSKLPNEILNAFKTNPIDTSILESQMGMESTKSVIDTLGLKPQQKQRKQQIVENNVPSQTRPIVQQQNIDYSLIKTIVEDCMKKYTSALKKSILTENTQNNSGNEMALMRIGESFKFVTKNGDIYEAKLIKRGNVNDKKQ